ncbi:MAG: hypothetical protein GX876_10145 [Bacteroidales bacterium]|nr:hypothetical protein [Bacteroidales bacterium]
METPNKSIGFSLKKISTEQFAIIEEGFNDKGKIRLNTSLRIAADDKQKYVAVFTSFIFDSDTKPFLIVEVSCHFQIKDSAWIEMHNPDTNTLVVPKGFLCHLAMLTIGTSRGILHVKTEGTCFNKYVLPTINVTEIIKEDEVFSFKNSEE